MFVISSVTLVSSAAALLYLAPILSLITLAVAPLIIISSYRRGSFRRIMNAERQRVGIHLSSIIHQTLSASGVMLIKNTGRQEYVCEQVRKLNVRLMALDMQQALYLKGGLMMFSRIVTAILPAIIYIVAGWQIINHRQLFGVNITAGTLVAFISLQARFLSPMRQLALMQTNLTTSLVHLERVLNHLELPLPIEEPQDPVRLEREEMRGEVHFRDVSFSYPVLRPERATISSAAEFCLTGLSFNINPGEKVALVGASGAGKTTVSYLLSRLYDVAGGAVLIDGHDVRSLSFATLSGLISVVTQESFLFHDTVRNNLLFARLDATESQIVNACKAAAIHERILKLPHSYDTMVGERGARFSGGEKQRLSIARAILKDSPILILDEATSSLDSCSEDIVQAALNRLTVGRSTLIIAHRLSTVVIADRIVVFDAGKMVDQGSHLELLRRCTVYRTLYANQFGVGKKTEESDRVPVSC
jgi:ATP-binding cassette subfamily B protein